MTLPSLSAIANDNVPEYKERFDSKPEVERLKAMQLKADLVPSVNMHVGTVRKVILDRYKNKFEICFEENGITLDEFLDMPPEEQSRLFLTKFTDDNKQLGIRRLDFSSRYDEGFSLYYLGPHYRFPKDESQYGRYCVMYKIAFAKLDVALIHDSLKFYFDDEDVYAQTELESELIPCTQLELLLSDKYETEIPTVSIDEIEQIIDLGNDAFEMMTTTLLDKDMIIGVRISHKLMDEINELTIRLNDDEELTGRQKEMLSEHLSLLTEARRSRLRIEVIEEPRE